jgi:uncharacterized protein involved in outer membrane biogenesis
LRDLLTGFALLLILVLSAALAGPYLVDWNSHRAWFEDQIAAAIGLPARIQGPIQMRLLPAPVIRVEALRIGDPGGGDTMGQGPVLTTGSATIEVAMAPLLKGEIRIVDASLDEPSLALTIGPDGTPVGLAALRAAATVPPVALETLRLRGGSLVISDQVSGRTAALLALQADAEAGSLMGPWRITGEAVAGQVPLSFRLTTGLADAEGLRLRLQTVATATQTRTDIDGRLSLTPAGAPIFDGKALVAGALPWPDPSGPVSRPWSASAGVKATGRTAALAGVEVQAGPDQAGVKLAGSGSLDLGPQPLLTLELATKQLDFDRPLAAPDRGPLSPRETLAAWFTALGAGQPSQHIKIPLRLTLGAEAALLGGDVLGQLQITALLQDNAVALQAFEAMLPGAAQLSAAGRLTLANGGGFAGRVGLNSSDPARLFGWLEGERSGRSARFGDAREISLQADVAVSPALLAARNLRLSVDRSSVAGTIRYTLAEEGRRARVEAQLVSEGLALEQTPDLSVFAGIARDSDIAVTLDARQVRVGRNGGPQLGAGRVALKFASDGQGLVLDTLDISDLGGASVQASGRLDSAGGRLDATIDARRVEPLAEMLQRLAPDLVPALVADRAPALGPLKLRLGFERPSAGAGTQLSFTGTAGATRISGAFELPAQGLPSGNVVLDAPDAGALLSQLGVETLPLTGLGRGRLDFRLAARQGDGTRLTLAGELAGTTIGGDGMLGGAANAAGFTGSLQLESADATPLLQILALPAPAVIGHLPAALRSQISLAKGKVHLGDLAATLAGASYAGTATLDTATRTLDAMLTTDRLSLADVTALVLGQPGQPAAGSLWSSARFPAMLPPPVDIALTLAGQTLDVGFGPRASAPLLRARWTPDSFAVSELHANWAGGQLAGSFTLRREGGQGALSGKMALKRAQIAQLLPASGLAGTLDLELDGGAAGQTPSGLVANLAGGGRIVIDDWRVPRLDVAALGAITAGFDQQRDPPDARQLREALAAGLDKGPLILARLEAPVSVAAGQIRVGPIGGATAAAALQGSAAFDLKTGRGEARGQIEAIRAPETWTGPAPQMTVEWRSTPAGGVARTIDAGSLANALITRAVTRELERMEAAEADLRERSFFVRRLRVEREAWERALREAEEARLAQEARQRAQEEQRQREEALARQKADAARRAAEEARRRAEQEERNAAQDRAGAAMPDAPRQPSAFDFFDPRADRVAPLPAPVEIAPAPAIPRQPSAP